MAINRRTRFKIFIRDDFTCQYCGLKAPAAELHVDHRVPRAEGGKDSEDNLVTACITCNSGKSDMLLPITLTLNDGPLAGQSIKTTAAWPMVWVWQDTNGNSVALHDELLDDDTGGIDTKAKYGPSPYYHPPKIRDAVVDRMRWTEDGRSSVLLGAYMPTDPYPFKRYAQLDWQEPWRLLIDFVCRSRSE